MPRGNSSCCRSKVLPVTLRTVVICCTPFSEWPCNLSSRPKTRRSTWLGCPKTRSISTALLCSSRITSSSILMTGTVAYLLSNWPITLAVDNMVIKNCPTVKGEAILDSRLGLIGEIEELPKDANKNGAGPQACPLFVSGPLTARGRAQRPYPCGSSLVKTRLPAAMNMPPTPWQNETLAPSTWCGASPRIWRTDSWMAYMPYMPEWV